MLLALLVLLSVANTEASDLDLLDGGVQKWSSDDRVARCPVHSKIQPVAADGGKGVSFVAKPFSGKRFSLLETYMRGLQGYGGLQLNFTSSGLGSWELRLYDGQTNCRFVYIVNKPDGAHSLTLPWSSFRAKTIRRSNTNTNSHTIQTSNINRLVIKLPNGPLQAQLTLQDMHALRDSSVMLLAATVTAGDDMAEGFDGPFVGMGITGHNDFAMMTVNSPAECAEACTQTAECRSFDYGAHGKVVGDCWRSLADRKTAGNAYESWEFYNYYEIKSVPLDAAATNAMGNPDTEMALSKDDLAAVMGFFDGPAVGMGITGHNDFAMVSVSDPAECAEACTQTAECSSFDYGARGNVMGQCWLSRADRKSAGNAYRRWELYDYYEIKATVNPDTKEDTKKEGAKLNEMAATKMDAAPMEGAKKDEMETTTTDASSLSSDSGPNVSHAQQLSHKPMAFVLAIGALVIFLAS